MPSVPRPAGGSPAEVEDLEVEGELVAVRSGQPGVHGCRLPGEQSILIGDRSGAGEPRELVREAVSCRCGRAVHQMEVQVRCGRVAGVAEQTDHLPGADPVPGLHSKASWLQVCVEGEATATQVDNDRVPAGGLKRERRQRWRDLVRLTVVDGDDPAGCDGEHVLAVSRVARELPDGPGEQSSLWVELDEVDGE